MTTTIRVPARLAAYMEGTGWAQGGNENDRAAVAGDPVRQRLLAALEAPRNADRSVSLKAPTPAMLARLYFEADNLQDSYLYGDRDPDTLADYNAARAMKRRVDALICGTPDERTPVRILMYAEAHGHDRNGGCYQCGIGALDSTG